MKLKKLTALLLCLALVLSLAACGGNNESSTSSKTEESSSESSSAEDSSALEESGTSTEGGDWFEGKDFSEKMTITLASVQIEDGYDYTAGDDWVKSWTDRFNVEWDIIPLTWDNWAERLRIWINSDDMPEMAVWNYVNGEAANYASQGLVKQLPDGWKDKYPNLAKANSDCPMSEMAEENFGGDFYLFRPIYSNNRPTEKLATHMSLFLRKDWAEAADVEISRVMKVSEIMDYLAKVKEKNPGNVSGDFYPLVTTSGNLAQFVGAYNYHGSSLPFYLGEDGQYHWNAADPETLEALKVLNKAYTDGLLHPEFYTFQEPDDHGTFYTTGTSAATIAGGMVSTLAEFEQHMRADLGVEFLDVAEIVTIADEDGNFHGTPLTNFWGANIFSPHIDDAKLDRILSMLDYSCTDEGQLEIRCGIKGVDWDFDEKGELYSNLGPDENLWDKYALVPVYVNMMVLSDDFMFQNPSYKQEIRDKVKQIHIDHQENSTDKTFPMEPDWNVELHDSQALNLASMEYGDEYAALIVKAGDIEANWQAWVNEKMPTIQPVLDELNEKLG